MIHHQHVHYGTNLDSLLLLLFDYRNAIFSHVALLPPLDLILGEVHDSGLFTTKREGIRLRFFRPRVKFMIIERLCKNFAYGPYSHVLNAATVLTSGRVLNGAIGPGLGPRLKSAAINRLVL